MYCMMHYVRWKKKQPLLTDKERFILDNPPRDGVGYIPLTRGLVATVDTKAYIELIKYNWWANSRGYAARWKMENGRKVKVSMHREILGCKSDEEGEHRDGDIRNNRRSNLRPSTHTQNMQNKGKSASWRGSKTSSPYKGVAWVPDDRKWKTTIKWKGRQWTLGRFVEEEDAAIVYNVAAQLLFGEFARLNVID